MLPFSLQNPQKLLDLRKNVQEGTVYSRFGLPGSCYPLVSKSPKTKEGSLSHIYFLCLQFAMPNNLFQ